MTLESLRGLYMRGDMDLIGPAKNGDGVCRLGFFGILPRFSRHGQRADLSVCPLRICLERESPAP